MNKQTTTQKANNKKCSRLGQLLVERKLITQTQLNEAISEQRNTHKKLGEILIARRLITERQLKRGLKWQTLVRSSAVVSVFLLSPFQYVQAETRLASPQANPQQVTIQTNLKNLQELPNSQLPSLGVSTAKVNHLSSRKVLVNTLKTHLSTPVVTLLQGEYEGGVDKYSTGLNYKAKWSKKGIKVELKYQF